LVFFLTSGWLWSCASARKNWYHGGPDVGAYGLDLVVDGSLLPVFEHRGRSYTEGRSGVRYVVRVHNWGSGRVEAVVSVDGRDVIDGRAADTDKRGYIIEPHSYVDVEGWRTSLDDVAAFRFTSVPDSYTARMGTPGKAGKVEVAIFAEREPPPLRRPLTTTPTEGDHSDLRMEEERAPSTLDYRRRKQNLGTRFGESRLSQVTETEFERKSSRPVARLGLAYDNSKGLCELGISLFCYPQRPPYRQVESRPPQREFAQPPPGWEHFHPWY
jgi:hypothetical protein